MMKWINLGWIVLSFAAHGLELSQLEHWQQQQSLGLSDAVIAERAARLQRLQAESGWQVFGSLGSGWQREAVDEQRTRRYGSLNERLGLSYSLLGGQQAQQRAQQQAESELSQAQWLQGNERQQNRLRLRAAYGDGWMAQRRYRLAQDFLSAEAQVRPLLQQRQQQGLLLPSDRMEFETAFDLARRDAATARALQQQARDQLELLTGQAIDPQTSWQPVQWPSIPEVLDVQALEQDALLQQTLQQQQLARQQKQQTDWGSAELRLSVGQGLSQQMPGDWGADTGVQLDLRMPLRWHAQRDALRAEYQAQADQAGFKALQRRQELQDRLAQLRLQQQTAQANLQFAQARQQSALQAVSERQLRLAHLDGDVLEQSIKSQFALYQAQAALLDAWHQQYGVGLEYWALLNQWPQPDRLELPDWPRIAQQAASQSPPLPRQFAPAGSSAGCLTLYLWSTESLLTDLTQQAQLWPQWREAGVCRLWLSLNAEQIRKPDQTRQALQQFLNAAHQQPLRVEWLLAEPSWILPKSRSSLFQLIEQFKAVGFDGLHLDLEPEQLQAKPDHALLQQWLATIEQVSRRSPWPVGLSLHPRHLEHRGTAQSPCIGCRLQQLPLTDVTLMIYQRPVERVKARFQSIRQQFPKLCLGVAQSAEASLSRAESYADFTQPALLALLTDLAQSLSADRFCGVSLQSWQEFQEMPR